MDSEAAPTAADGRVVKRAADRAQATRIVAEAEVLAAGQIPGVVELIAVDGDAEHPCLVTARVDGPDLGQTRRLGVEEVAGIVAAVATTLADLHDLGLVHGAVMASHVLVGPDGRPVLCGFGYGGRVGSPPVAEAPLPDGFADPSRRVGAPLAPVADVYALGGLLRSLVRNATVAPVPMPSRPYRLPTPVGRRLLVAASSVACVPLRSADRSARRALVAVAGRATVVDPGGRLGARSLAQAVGLAVPGARLPRRSGPEPTPQAAAPTGTDLGALRQRSLVEPPRPTDRRPKRLVLAVGCGVIVAALALRALLGTTPRRPPAAAGPAAPVSAAPSATAGAPTTAARGVSDPGATSRRPVAAAPRSDCPPVTAALAADTDGDGCPETLRWTDGVLEAGDRRWAVGQAGDQVAIADWSCSGRGTLALLRPATGDVFVFDQWAPAGHDLVARVAGRVEGGFAIRAAELGDRCPRVAVDRGDGAPVTLPGPPP